MGDRSRAKPELLSESPSVMSRPCIDSPPTYCRQPGRAIKPIFEQGETVLGIADPGSNPVKTNASEQPEERNYDHSVDRV